MTHWQTAEEIASGNDVQRGALNSLKSNLGLHPSRLIRFADRSDTEDLIIFEVKNAHIESYMLPEERVKHQKREPYLLVVSIAPDDVPEHLVIVDEERMEGVTAVWL